MKREIGDFEGIAASCLLGCGCFIILIAFIVAVVLGCWYGINFLMGVL